MATVFWTGTAPKVAQISTATPADVDIGDTFKLHVGSEDLTFVATAATVANVCTGLQALWAASTHPYHTTVGTTDDATHITFTAINPGVEFICTSSIIDGLGGLAPSMPMATTTANAGPNVLTTPANWSAGAIPAIGDMVVIEGDIRPNICWDLGGLSAVNLGECTISQTFTGSIGLNSRKFAITADATGYSETPAPEYRAVYLDAHAVDYYVGRHDGPGSPSGSARLMLDVSTSARIRIHNTGRQASEPGLPAVRLLSNTATGDLYIRRAPGGVGLAVDAPDETSQIDYVQIAAAGNDTRVQLGDGVTMDRWRQDGSNSILAIGDGRTVSSATVNGGTLTTEGAGDVTTVNACGGLVTLNHHGGAGVCVTVLELEGGVCDLAASKGPRTVTTGNLHQGVTLKGDTSVVTITTLNAPADGPYQLEVS